VVVKIVTSFMSRSYIRGAVFEIRFPRPGGPATEEVFRFIFVGGGFCGFSPGKFRVINPPQRKFGIGKEIVKVLSA
jgi:hypothetical protein